MTLPRLGSLLASLAVAAILVTSALPATAGAAPALPSSDPFYAYSGSLTSFAPGTVLRTRSVTLAFEAHTTPVSATQILYRTVGALGQPTVTVTTVIRPLAVPVLNRIVSWQMFYDALGSQCDPSYTLQGGNNSYGDGSEETALFAPYLAAGDIVVVPDYEGENLDWGAGRESGENTLDGIRAAEQFLGLSSPSAPVAMVGYSGGSIATEWAAELAPSYAPNLDIVATAAGGVPVDFAHNLAYINGSPSWSGVIPAVLVGVARAYHIDLAPYLSAYGAKVVGQVSGGCINDFTGAYPGLTIQQLLKPQYQDFLAVPIFARIVDQLIMSSGGTPGEPVLLAVGNADGTGDGVMVAADVQALAYTYCQRGATVEFDEYRNASHTYAAPPFEARAEAFVTARLAGVPVANLCPTIAAGNSLAPIPVQSGGSTGPAPSSPAPSSSGTASHEGAAVLTSNIRRLPATGVPVRREVLLAAGLLADGLLLVGLGRAGRRPSASEA